MVAQNLPVLLAGIFLGARKSCNGFFNAQPTSISYLASFSGNFAAARGRGYGYVGAREGGCASSAGDGADHPNRRLASSPRPGISLGRGIFK